jgi:DNA mismatch repair protein MutL
LDKKTINQIAAGEVVERPASVVKELVENAIDANSKKIIIELQSAGKKLIRVTDDGDGIHPDEMKIAFEKHSTSKISKINDIYNLITLGFRGEALASIAAVAMIECISCDGKNLPGRKLVLEGGKVKSFTEIGSAKGTTIKIKELFYNIPARLKYLKSDQTELAHIIDAVTHLALYHNMIGFKLIHNSHEFLNFPAAKLQINNLINIYGKEMVRELLPLQTIEEPETNPVKPELQDMINAPVSKTSNRAIEGIKLSGFIGKPSITRSDRGYQTVFVNGRYVECKVFSDAIKEAYRTLVMKNRHPIVILFIEADPGMFDVNISPTKTLVRFENESKLYNKLYKSIHGTLKSHDLIPEATLPNKPQTVTLKAITTLGVGKPGYLPPTIITDSQKTKQNVMGKDTSFDSIRTAHQSILKPGYEHKLEHYSEFGSPSTDNLRAGKEPYKEPNQNYRISGHPMPGMGSTLKFIQPVGQVMDTYIIAQAGEAMFIIDQHAASERIMYEKIKNRYNNSNMSTQELLSPVELELAPKELGLLKSNLNILKKLNFEIAELGDNNFYVKGIPIILGRLQDRELIHDIINDLISITTEKQHDIIKDKMMQIMACKAAIKAGKSMTIPEIQQLLNELYSIENPYTCAHGRPTIISLSDTQLRKLFKRIV